MSITALALPVVAMIAGVVTYRNLKRDDPNRHIFREMFNRQGVNLRPSPGRVMASPEWALPEGILHGRISGERTAGSPELRYCGIGPRRAPSCLDLAAK
jgi:hypothetical protein